MRKREIVDIRFEGNSNITALELQSIIATRTSSWLDRAINSVTSGGTPRQFIDSLTQAEDTLRIFVYYRNRGYFDAKIGYSLHESKESADEWQKVHDQNKFLPPKTQKEYPFVQDTVVFHIIEGKAYTVAGFTFEGFEHLPLELQNTVTENIGIKVNSQYSKVSVDLEAIRAKEVLEENGYPFLSLPYGRGIDVEKDTLRKTVTISMIYITGPRVKFGQIKIVYDTAYKKSGYVRESAVLRQLNIDSGAWYKKSDILISERDLSRLGTFQYVNIELDTAGFSKLSDSAKDGMTVGVIIYLRMRQPWDATIGPYAGSSSKSEFIFGVGGSYTNRNLFSGGENLTLQASYQVLPWFTTQKRWSIGGDFVLPYFILKNVPFIASPSFSYAWEFEKYLEEIISLSLGTNVDILNSPSLKITLSPKMLGQRVRREFYDTAFRSSVKITYSAKPQANTIGSYDLVFNWTNNPQYPSTGSYISHSFQWALPMFHFPSLPSAAYIKNTLQFKTYFNLASTFGRSVLAYRIVGGLIALYHPEDPDKDPLIENRYYGGGTNSLRGWASRSLLVSNNNVQGRPQFGGFKVFETNLEWRYALFHYPVEITAMQQFLGALRLAVFCDVGNVFDKDIAINPKDFAITLGTGLHYNTMFGAVRLDFGLKFYDPYPDPYPPGTLGAAKKDKDLLLAIPPNSSKGVWLFNRKNWLLGDILNIEFALGQAF